MFTRKEKYINSAVLPPDIASGFEKQNDMTGKLECAALEDETNKIMEHHEVKKMRSRGLLLFLLRPASGCQTIRERIFTLRSTILAADERGHSPDCFSLTPLI